MVVRHKVRLTIFRIYQFFTNFEGDITKVARSEQQGHRISSGALII